MTRFDLSQRMDMDEGVKAYEVQGKAIDQVNNWNLPLGEQPVWHTNTGQAVPYKGEIPADLTTLNDDQLGMYLTLLSNWIDYVGGKLASVDSARTQAKEQMKFVSARIRLTYKTDAETGKKLSNPERDDMVTTDLRFVEANSRYLYFENLYAYTRTVHDSAEQKYKAVSRRITQRQDELSRGTRGSTVGSIRPGNMRR